MVRAFYWRHSPHFVSARDEQHPWSSSVPVPGVPGAPPAGARAGPTFLHAAPGERGGRRHPGCSPKGRVRDG